MTMTGRTVPTQIRDEYGGSPSGEYVWSHEYGAIDAATLVPAGSTVPCYVGRHGFGVPRSISREQEKCKTKRAAEA